VATDRWGIVDRYHDALGVERVTSDRTRAAILTAMGCDPSSAAAPPEGDREPDPTGCAGPLGEHVRVIRAGTAADVDAPGMLTLEDGTAIGIERALPPDLPIGYHRLRPTAGPARRCSSSGPTPASCPTACAPGAGRRSSTPRDRRRAGGSEISAT